VAGICGEKKQMKTEGFPNQVENPEGLQSRICFSCQAHLYRRATRAATGDCPVTVQ